MSDVEKLNALTRLSIYLSIILFVIYRDYKIFFIAIVSAVILSIIYYAEKRRHISNQEQFEDKIKTELAINKDTAIKVNENGDICQLPTPNNPFMNVLMTDYTDNPNRPPACNYNDKQVSEMRDQYFNYNLYKDVEDVWEKRNSQREYVTLPGMTIPNDRDRLHEMVLENDLCLQGW